MKIRMKLFVALGLGILVAWGMLFLNQSIVPNHVLAQNQTKEEIFNHISQLAKKTDSYHAEVTTVEEREGKPQVTKGKAMFKWPNMSWRESRRSRDHKLIGLSVSNGKIKWTYIPRVNSVLKYDVKALDEDAQLKGWLSADELDEASLEYVGTAQLGGEKVYVIEGEHSALIKHENPDSPGTTRFYVGTKDGIIRKVISFNQEGREIGSQTFSNIRIDRSISEKDFEFTPPEGTQIHEINDVGPRINPDEYR